ncbi:hypothetical protein [Paucibacter sp. DJ2R-2]|uniref:hypothetical protein n=1 Tax=Paucibacter sp. DJ2R-2 TaxID=2893558 RepID=UPI0021E4EE4E|nr:hypothetical protein [Paucibacter sp. DJ2R-2]MCV2423120.1 hypothetical protein [Paucibacter sp. DJ4R-1]
MTQGSGVSMVLRELKSQWQASVRLRIGGWLVLLILALYGMQEGLDLIERRRDQLSALDAEVSRLRSLTKEREWPERAGEAAKRQVAMASMAWSESDLSLSEAAFQDWLRTVPAKLGLITRSLVMARMDGSKAGSDIPQLAANANLASGTNPPPGFVVLKARVNFELQRAPLMVFLAECARSERSVVVERMAVRTQSQPPTVELDLRVLARKSEVKP